MPPLISCWTKLTVPKTCTIDDATSEDGEKWLRASTYVDTTKTPGYMAQCFGRMTESPLTVFYITAWNSHDSLNEFEKSMDSLLQHEEHAKLSSTPLETFRYEVRCSFWMYLTKNVGFFDAYFPASISPESKKIVDGARGLVYHYAPHGPNRCAYVTRPTRGWFHGTQKYEGQDAIVVRLWHFWKNEETERDFKAGAGITAPRLGMLSLYNYLMEQLKEAGVLGIQEFHCPLVRIWDYYTEAEGGPNYESEDVLIS
ncbi:uncharacterized protein K460DRAFT_357154 [Cucurbitaria berberidis CBS 394.84]|uniref:Uncharacterized protein n=1 Tax=Cucurbitaria berberidis CBS 394.84 TaxID=1168544 RepID=A0A9P4L5Y6_9PLEO|nr:uncharacterized protein K460DRAFT_357154 [Cucurbitaria berberidis CBS 394.84]KAF1843426.1 hypothetical protein K460DRAFT_357154 [Cucurbitaria berberidis CBS 394.84]